MAEDVERRMEQVDRFISRLQKLTVDEWRQISASHRSTSDFYTLAQQRLLEATRLAGLPRAQEYEAFLGERNRRIDEMLMRLASESWEPIPRFAPLMAKAAANAILMRNLHGFNVGAYSELMAPFRRYLDFGDPNGPSDTGAGQDARR